MSQAVFSLAEHRPAAALRAAAAPGAWAAFVLGGAALALGAAALAGWAPIGFSIVTVFLFAGPHNWLEGRYFLQRVPARWGQRFWLYAVGLGGAAVLTAAFVALTFLPRFVPAAWDWAGAWHTAWNTALVLWIAWLAAFRARERGRDSLPVWAAACGVLAWVWLWPAWWSVALVYLHPLVAFWFLRRELRRRRPEWLPAYHALLALVPLLLLALWWRLGSADPLPGEDALTSRIVAQAGGQALPGLSSRFLVAAHAFLETLHYGVWVLAIPLLTWRGSPLNLRHAPLAKLSPTWNTALLAAWLLGGLFVAALWGGFLADHALTRDVYFTLAIGHVLAEFSFVAGWK